MRLSLCFCIFLMILVVLCELTSAARRVSPPQKQHYADDNDDGDTSEEIQVIQHRIRKEDRKKTLGDVIKEKKMKKQIRKEKFKRNVLKYFDTGEDASYESSEEVVAPIRKYQKPAMLAECDSGEEVCM